MRTIDDLVRPTIRDLVPYSSAREEHTVPGAIFLDANENALGSTVDRPQNRYPDPAQHKLRELLAAHHSLDPEQIFVGNGSDEGIDLLIRAFCEPAADGIIVLPPTYGMYSVCAAVNNVHVTSVPLTPDFQIDLTALRTRVKDEHKLLFLCSPNNPTGNVLEDADVRELLDWFDGLVIIDQAYVDFCPRNSWVEHLRAYSGLVILQTLSKAWGMAGIRVGMAFAHPQIVAILRKIKYPYNVNGVSQELGAEALRYPERMREMVKLLNSERDRLARELESVTCVLDVFPSAANFLLVRMKNVDAVYAHLLRCGIVVRDRSRLIHCENCLRITVGTEDQNLALIKALNRFEEHL